MPTTDHTDMVSHGLLVVNLHETAQNSFFASGKSDTNILWNILDLQHVHTNVKWRPRKIAVF